MSTATLIPALALFTLIAVLIVALVAHGLFLRKRENRHPVETPSQRGKTMAPTHPEG
jgi:hypothetical protein